MKPTRTELTLNLADGITLANGALVMNLTGPGGQSVEISIPLTPAQAGDLAWRLEDFETFGEA